MSNKKTFNSKYATPSGWESSHDDNNDNDDDDNNIIPGGYRVDDDADETWTPDPSFGVTPVLTNNPHDLDLNSSPFVIDSDSKLESQKRGVRRRRPTVKDPIMPFVLMTPEQAKERGVKVLPKLTEEELDAKRQSTIDQGIPLTQEESLLHAGPVAMNIIASQHIDHKCSKCDGTGQSGLVEVRRGFGTRPVPCSNCHGYGHTDFEPSALGGVMDVRTSIGTLEQHWQRHDKLCHRSICLPDCAYKPVIDPIRESMEKRGDVIEDRHVKVRTGSTPELKQLLARPLASDLWEPTAAGLLVYGGRNRLAGASSDVLSIGRGSIVGIANHSLEDPYGVPGQSTTHPGLPSTSVNADSPVEMLPSRDRSMMGLVNRVATDGRSWEGWVDARSSEEIAAHDQMWKGIRRASGIYPYELDQREISNMFNSYILDSDADQVRTDIYRNSLQDIIGEWSQLFGRKSTAPYAVTLSAQPRVSGRESTGSNLVYRKNIPMRISFLHSPHSAIASRSYGTRTGKRIQTSYGDAKETDDVAAQYLRGPNSFSTESLLRHIEFGDPDGSLLRALHAIDTSRGGTPGDESDPLNLTPKATLRGQRIEIDPETITRMNSVSYDELGSTSGRSETTTPIRTPELDIDDNMYHTPEFKTFLKKSIEADLPHRVDASGLTDEQIDTGIEAMKKERSLDIEHAKRAIFHGYL